MPPPPPACGKPAIAKIPGIKQIRELAGNPPIGLPAGAGGSPTNIPAGAAIGASGTISFSSDIENAICKVAKK
jgi:hypothetical protein